MASQHTRSAFMLTTIAIFSVGSSLLQLATAKAINELSGFSETINVPKFGDRISPRNRSLIDLEKLTLLRTVVSRTNSDDLITNSNSNNHLFQYQNSRSSGSNSILNNSTIKNKQKLNYSVNDSSKRENIEYNSDDNNNNKSNNNNNNEYIDGDDDSDDATEENDNVVHFLQQSSSSLTAAEEFNFNKKLNKFTNGRSLYNINAQSNDSNEDDADVNNTNNNNNNVNNNEGDADVYRSKLQTNAQLLAVNNDIDIRDGNASSAQAHRLEMSTEFFVVPSTFPSIIKSSSNQYQQQHRPGGIILPSKAKNLNKNIASIVPPYSNNMNRLINTTQPTIISIHNPLGLRKEPWVVPVLVLTSLAILMMAAFEIFVLCKAWQTSPSRRHLFLGQMLLFGLFLCASLAAILTTTPTVLSCGIVRFGAGVAFALVFASLLVKCVFLISLNSGVYLPAPYQGLLLLFAVLIQVAVSGQWLLTTPAAVEHVSVPVRNGPLNLTQYALLLTAHDITMTIPLCKTQFPELLYSLVYVICLILFVAVLAIKSRRIRENYREATYIGLAIGGSIPIWLGWTLCGLAVTDRHKDACLAFGLVATSATVFLVMFMPKGRQLAAMGKEGLYIEDRDEQFSSISRAGSGYSPSFFHFKPIKYGVMGNTLASTTHTTNHTSSKHQAVASLGNGK